MPEEPQVSIITPCHNDGRFLHLPLDSVREQTYRRYEHIVVNDGSTSKETLAVLEQIADPKVTVIHQSNTGLAAARNAGIRRAGGTYILPLDADDKIEPKCLERLVGELEAHPEAAVAYGNYRLFGSDNRELITGQFNTYRILFANFMPVCSLFRRSAWEAVGGYTEQMGGFEDWEFWIKLVERGFVFRKVDEVLYLHHVHDANMWLRDKGKWRTFVAQIHSLHPHLYAKENVARLRQNNHVTWLEDLVFSLPVPLRFTLHRRLPSWPIRLANAIGLYRGF